MFKTVFKESYRYIAAIAMTMTFIFISINISYNEIIYMANLDPNETLVELMPGIGFSTPSIEVIVKPESVQNKVLLMTVLIIAAYTVIANNSFLKKRVKEFAFLIANGGTSGDVFYYLRYMCTRVFLIGSSIGIIGGIIGGIIFAPLFNFILYKFLGVSGPIIRYEPLALQASVGFLFVNLIYILIIGLSYIYQKEVIELINSNREKNVKDTRQFKFPSIIYFLVYLLPIVVVVMQESMGDMSGFAYVVVYISAIASVGVINLYIPSKISWINKRKFMFDKKRKIYVNEGIAKLRGSILYIIGIFCTINYFVDMILKYKDFGGTLGVIMYSIMACGIVIAITLMNKIIDEFDFIYENYKNLYKIGYSKNDVLSIAGRGLITNIVGVIVIPAIPICISIYVYIVNGSVTMEIIGQVLALIMIPVAICGGITYSQIIKKLNRTLSVEVDKVTENSMNVLEDVA